MDISDMIAISEKIFSYFDINICQILLRSGDVVKSRSLKWVKSQIEGKKGFDSSYFDTVQIFPTSRKTIDETWRPLVYLAFNNTSSPSGGSIFFSSSAFVEKVFLSKILGDVEVSFTYCAGYIFDFPTCFSPLAYYWGIVVDPAEKGAGRFDASKADRLEFWRDNTELGIASEIEGKRKFYGACDGFVRDAYPMMILNERHLNRSINGISLRKFLESNASIEKVNGRNIIEIPIEKLMIVQYEFDKNAISLSGSRIMNK